MLVLFEEQEQGGVFQHESDTEHEENLHLVRRVDDAHPGDGRRVTPDPGRQTSLVRRPGPRAGGRVSFKGWDRPAASKEEAWPLHLPVPTSPTKRP